MGKVTVGLVAGILIGFIHLSGTYRAEAQTVNGTILGFVQDQQRGVIPGAEVSARNLETGAVRAAISDEAGAYRVSSVPAGPYELTVVMPGFKTEVRSGIKVTVGSEVGLNFVLSVGAREDQVVVTGDAPLVDTVSSTMGGVVNDNTVRELPLNGRDWLQLAGLQPGATLSSVQFQNDVSRLPRGNGQAISISGARPSENVYRVDGLVINDFANSSPGSSLWVNLGVDAIREFSVLTNTFSAEYGRSSGGVVNAITKSGGNDIHGTAFYFTRNSALDARNTFDQQLPPFRRHQFGGSIGGPIKKEKTFYFTNYEGLHEFKSLSFSSDTLSPNARNGILATGSPVTVDSRIKPYLALYPIPNGAITGDAGKFVFGGGRDGREDFVIGKVDHSFSAGTTLNSSYRFDDAEVNTPDAFNQKLTAAQSRHQDFVLGVQHVFSPTLLNNFRFGFTRTRGSDGFDLRPRTPLLTDISLGFLPGIPVGDFNVTGLSSFGGIGDTGADLVGYTAAQAYDDLALTKGHHSVRAGFAFERIYDNVNPQTTPNGSWVFGSIRTLLTASPSQFVAALPGTDTQRGLRSSIIAGYLQDDFRFRSNLTFNLGVRYETSTPTSEVHGKLANLRNITDAKPTPGNPLFQNPTLRNFEPRVGVVWDPFKNGKTSIRAGAGIYDVLPLPHLFWNRATHGTPFFQAGVVNNPAAASFPNHGLALIQPGTLRVAYIEYQPHRPYKMQWNLNIQRQISTNISVMVGYVGSSGVHLPVGQNDADEVPPNFVTKTADGHYRFQPNAPRINPNFGRLDTMLWYGHTSYHSLQTNLTKRLSHGLSMQGTYTWSKNIDNGSAFFSQNETPNNTDNPYVFDARINRAVSNFDAPHSAAINVVWQLPSSQSTQMFSRFLLSGWQLGGIFTEQSGAPFTVGINGDRAGTGSSTSGAAGGQKPDFVPAPGCTLNAINPGHPDNYIRTECFAFPAAGTLGNVGRNSLRGPSVQDLDFSVFQTHAIREKIKAQFRAEAFNILNRANFQAQTVTLFDKQGKLVSNAGQLKPPTVTSSRQIQFGMKLIW